MSTESDNPTIIDPGFRALQRHFELNLLDAMAEFAKARDHGAYHFIRAYAHDLGYHLTGCADGRSDLRGLAPDAEYLLRSGEHVTGKSALARLLAERETELTQLREEPRR